MLAGWLWGNQIRSSVSIKYMLAGQLTKNRHGINEELSADFHLVFEWWFSFTWLTVAFVKYWQGWRRDSTAMVWFKKRRQYLCVLFINLLMDGRKDSMEWGRAITPAMLTTWKADSEKGRKREGGNLAKGRLPIPGLEPGYPAWKASMLTTYIISDCFAIPKQANCKL